MTKSSPRLTAVRTIDRARKRPSVLILSDVRLYREGLAALLENTKRVEQLGVLSSDSLEGTRSSLAPEVVVLDIELIKSGKVTLPLADYPAAKIIVFAVSECEGDLVKCAVSGASGFVARDASTEDILAAIEAAGRNELSCPPKIAGLLFQQLGAIARSSLTVEDERLTARELEVVKFLERGCSNKEIARELNIGVSTVKNHVHSVFEKLKVHRRGAAVRALRELQFRVQAKSCRWTAAE